MLLHVHCKKIEQPNMTEIPKEFIGNNQQARLQTFDGF